MNVFLKIQRNTRNRASAFNKKVVTHFDKNIVTYQKNGTDDAREESINEDPEEEPLKITVESKKTLLLINLKRTLLLINLKRILLLINLKRTLSL